MGNRVRPCTVIGGAAIFAFRECGEKKAPVGILDEADRLVLNRDEVLFLLTAGPVAKRRLKT
jgi:hypothetical protein